MPAIHRYPRANGGWRMRRLWGFELSARQMKDRKKMRQAVRRETSTQEKRNEERIVEIECERQRWRSDTARICEDIGSNRCASYGRRRVGRTHRARRPERPTEGGLDWVRRAW